MTLDKHGHDWQGNQCRHCGTLIHSQNADRDCGWRDLRDDDSSKFDVLAAVQSVASFVADVADSIPDATGDSSSYGSSDSFSSDAFSGGESGGGGGGADF